MIAFPDFEPHIAKKLIDRGFDYYEQDSVEDVEVVDAGEFSAVVQGTESYDVWVEIQGNRVVNQRCTCPYFEEQDVICKHIVATLYYIRDAEMHEEEYINTVAGEVKEVLSTLKIAELKEFVFAQAKKNRTFREDFFRQFKKRKK